MRGPAPRPTFVTKDSLPRLHAVARASLLVATLVVSSTASTAHARRAPVRHPVLVELAYRAGTEPTRGSAADDPRFEVELVVYADGSWTNGEVAGQLSPRERAQVAREASRARLVMDRGVYATCMALPTTTYRVRTPRGAIAWVGPCGPRPHATVRALMARVRALGAPTPEPTPPVVAPTPPRDDRVLVRYGYQSMRSLTDESPGLVLYADGRVEGAGQGAVLAAPELAEVIRMIRATTLGPAPHDQRHACAAMMTGQASIEIPGRGQHSWSTPCGMPHPSIEALLSRIRALAATR